MPQWLIWKGAAQTIFGAKVFAQNFLIPILTFYIIIVSTEQREHGSAIQIIYHYNLKQLFVDSFFALYKVPERDS